MNEREGGAVGWSEVVSGAVGGVVGGGFAIAGHVLQSRLGRGAEQRQRSTEALQNIRLALAEMEWLGADSLSDEEMGGMPADAGADRWVWERGFRLRQSLVLISHEATREGLGQVLETIQRSEWLSSKLHEDMASLVCDMARIGQDLAAKCLRGEPISDWRSIPRLALASDVMDTSAEFLRGRTSGE